MNNWKKICWGLCLLNSLLANSAEPSQSPKRRVTLSLGLIEEFNSNEGMKHLPLTTIQGYSWVFDQATKMTHGEISRAALLAAEIILHMPYLGKDFNASNSNWFSKEKFWPYLSAYHEFGHARGHRAFSGQPFKGYEVGIGAIPKENISSVMWYYVYSFKHVGFINHATTHISFPSTNYIHRLPIFAGGLNNESRLSSEIADWTYRFNGHIAYFWPYVRGKTGLISASSS